MRLRQSILRDSVAHHAARLGLSIKDGDLVPGDCGVVGRSQAGGTGADDGDSLPGGGGDFRAPGGVPAQIPIGDESLHIVDADRVVDQIAPAVGLAGVGADAATGGREGVAVLDDADCGLEVGVHHQSQVALNVDVIGAGLLTGRFTVGVVIAQQLLESHLSVGLDHRGMGTDGHAFADGRDAGLDLACLRSHLDHAQPAVAVGAFQPDVVAQRWDLDALLGESRQYCQAVIDVQFASVHGHAQAVVGRQLLH